MVFTAKEVRWMVQQLMDWFSKNARDLPWRRTRDPYAIWISEVMLQQTQVKTVIPYWERWMARLPSVETLALAPIETVLQLWSGLGYYSRARNLHEAARIILSEKQGKTPDDLEQWLQLPGVGRYTAGAICSIALNQPVPILDGNVIRVLTRFKGEQADPAQKAVRESLWTSAKLLVQQSVESKLDYPCSILNQSLMELGALICLPTSPLCSKCPLQKQCVARKTKCIDKIPFRPQKKATHRHCWITLILEKNGAFLVKQRPEDGINAGLWEFPSVKVPAACKDSIDEAITSSFGMSSLEWTQLGRVSHTITNNRMQFHVIRLNAYQGKLKQPKDFQWVRTPDLPDLAWAGAHRKILKLIAASSSD